MFAKMGADITENQSDTVPELRLLVKTRNYEGSKILMFYQSTQSIYAFEKLDTDNYDLQLKIYKLYFLTRLKVMFLATSN